MRDLAQPEPPRPSGGRAW